jgi:predicted lipid-binding transport protein (Tim44 family)
MNASLATAPQLSAPASQQNGRSPGGHRNGGGRRDAAQQQQQQMMMGGMSGGVMGGMGGMGGMGMMAPGMGMGMQELMVSLSFSIRLVEGGPADAERCRGSEGLQGRAQSMEHSIGAFAGREGEKR